MVRAFHTDHRLTFDEYLEFEEHSDVRHELVDGYLYAFDGASARHSLINVNVTTLLRVAARGTSCRVYDSDMKLRVSPSVGYYPDVMVGCDPEDNHDLYRTRPCLLVEILSPSTSLTDRREKRIAYQDITSLRGYVMVYRDEYRVESYTRNSENAWGHEDLGVDDEVWFPCVNLTVQVRDLYEDVDMPSIMAVTDDPNIR